MDKFVVSARKYRPQTFDTVVGQSHITTTLKNAIKNSQLAHAYLFCGPRGVGKTTCARIFAKTINCEHPTPEGEACDQCTSCKSFNEGTSLNISELDAASNNSVEDIRTLVEQVRFTPQAGKYKVYIIDEVHMLSQAAFNAFLKTLEEPPSYVVFILATTEKHKLLPTILSRCQIFDFKRITNQDTIEHLESIAKNEHVAADLPALQIIAQKSEGCMRDALSIMDKIVSFTGGKLTYQNTLENLNILDDDYYFKLLDSFQQEDLASALLIYNEINRKGFEGDIFINGLQDFLRNLLVCQNPKAVDLLDVVAGFENKYQEKAKEIAPSFIISALNVLNEAEIGFKAARNKRLHVEMAIIKLNYLRQAIELNVTGETVVKKKRIDGPIALKVSTLSEKRNGTISNNPVNTTASKPTAPSKPIESKLYIEDNVKPSSVATSVPVVEKNPVKTVQPKLGKKVGASLLDSLIQHFEEDNNKEKKDQAIPLEMEKLKVVWNDFTNTLIAQDKLTAANTFKAAILEIPSPNMVLIKVQAKIQQKFVEVEKLSLSEKVKEAFQNREIDFEIEVMEDDAPMDRPVTLNTREKFEIMTQKNPNLWELKEKLKLIFD